MQDKVQVKFLKAMYPYIAGDVGFVTQSIVDTYPEYVELVKTKEVKKEAKEDVKEIETTKSIDEAPANKAVTKKSTK